MTARDHHPGEHRFHQVDQLPADPILRLRSLGALCALRHRRLLGPRCWGTLSWPTRFSRRPGSRRYSVLKFNRDRDIPSTTTNTATNIGDSVSASLLYS